MSEQNETLKENLKVKNEKFDSFHKDMTEIAEKYGVAMMASVFFREEEKNGIQAFGTQSALEQAGLAKFIEQQYIS